MFLTRFYNDKKYYIDNSKIKKLGYKNKKKFVDSINDIIEFYKQFFKQCQKD